MKNSQSDRVSAQRMLRGMVGSPADWNLRKPVLFIPRPVLGWVGPILIAVSVAASWPAFSVVADRRGYVAWGFFVGTASIILMSWSFVLSLRPRILEPIFGGLDSMYRVHRWLGVIAVVAMFLHTDIEPKVKDGILGTSAGIAKDAKELASVGEYALYMLVAISLLRWFPYRYWRWTHKLLGIPFVFACWHFFTARKTYANGSGWGWFFGAIMVVGTLAYLGRVVGYDMAIKGKRYRVVNVVRSGVTSEISLAPITLKLRHKVGQFATLKLQLPGLSEPHTFTIASAPEEENLRFYIRDLGDWTAKIQAADLDGAEVFVEGPHGLFSPFPKQKRPTYWIAGGVGITPFLSAISSLTPSGEDERPTLLYCVQKREDATASDALIAAAAEKRIHLEWFESSRGRRFDQQGFSRLVGAEGLSGAHVAVCGPAGLVRLVVKSSRALGAREVETEAFDLRAGLGPDLSVSIEDLLGR